LARRIPLGLQANLLLGVMFLTLPTLGDVVDLTLTYLAFKSHPIYWLVNEAATSFKTNVVTHGYFSAALNAISHNLVATLPLLITCATCVCVAHLLRSDRVERLALIISTISSALIFILHLYGGLSWFLLR
jgi:hypothetical protein